MVSYTYNKINNFNLKCITNENNGIYSIATTKIAESKIPQVKSNKSDRLKLSKSMNIVPVTENVLSTSLHNSNSNNNNSKLKQQE